MSFSDCEKCWDTPCRCGHGYRDWTPEALREHIAMLETVLRGKYLAATTAVVIGHTTGGTEVMGIGRKESETQKP